MYTFTTEPRGDDLITSFFKDGAIFQHWRGGNMVDGCLKPPTAECIYGYVASAHRTVGRWNAEIMRVELADKAGVRWAQEQVTLHHYLHRPVDPRCSVLTYLVMVGGERVGCLIFGRPEATRCYPWYGSVADVATGRARLSRWEIINLARVWLSDRVSSRGGLS